MTASDRQGHPRPEAIIVRALREFRWRNYALEPPSAGPDADWIDALAGEISLALA